MPSDDLIVTVKQITAFPPRPQVGSGDSVILQAGPNGPFYSSSIQNAVATALNQPNNQGLGVGAPLPLGSGGNILAGAGFVSPLDTGLLFNCYNASVANPLYFPKNIGLTYLTPGVAGALLFNEAGFVFLGFPAGNSNAQVMPGDAAATLSRDGILALRTQATVGRWPIGPNEVVTLDYLWRNAIVRNPGNGKISLTPEDIHNAGGATAWNAALAGYPTAQTPVPEAHGNEIVTAEWAKNFAVGSFNGKVGAVCLTLWDIVYAGGAPILDPFFKGKPRAPTAEPLTDDDQIATTAYVDEAIEAVGILTGPPGPIGPQGPQGVPGTGINFKGTVPTFADLPSSGNMVGDMYIALDTNDGYIWEDPSAPISGHQPPANPQWVLIGMITPQTAVLISVTPPSLPGEGDLWWDNTTAQLMIFYAGAWVVANLGATGAQGPQGIPGAEGPVGPPGPTGGANAPISATPPASPNAGDFWWNNTQGLLMVYINGTWVPASGAAAASAAIGGVSAIPTNAITPTGWGYIYGAVGVDGVTGGPYGAFMMITQPEGGFPPGNVGSVMGDGQNAYLYGVQVNAWNYGIPNQNRPILTRVITGLPQPVPRASIQVNAGAVMPQGFYYGGQLSTNQGYVAYLPSGPNKFPSASLELFYSDGINFTCQGNQISGPATFIPVGVAGLNNGVIGPTVTFAPGALVPAGVWYCFETSNNVTNNASLVLLPGTTNAKPSPLNPNLNFLFFSDGTFIEVAGGQIELNQVIFS